jgi:hypothetical protein
MGKRTRLPMAPIQTRSCGLAANKEPVPRLPIHSPLVSLLSMAALLLAPLMCPCIASTPAPRNSGPAAPSTHCCCCGAAEGSCCAASTGSASSPQAGSGQPADQIPARRGHPGRPCPHCSGRAFLAAVSTSRLSPTPFEGCLARSVLAALNPTLSQAALSTPSIRDTGPPQQSPTLLGLRCALNW